METKIYQGQLKRWKKDKGFGFIGTEGKKQDIFIHISALKNMSRPPVVGDTIYYQLHTDKSGRNRAVNAKIEGVAPIKPKVKPKEVKKTHNNWLIILLVFILIAISAGFFFYNQLNEKANPIDGTLESPTTTILEKQE